MTLPPAAAVVFVAITVLLWVGAALLWAQTYRAPENVPVRMFAVAITLLAVTSVLRGFAGGSYLSVLANNVLGVVTAAIQVCFFVSVERGRAGAPRMRAEILVAAAVCVVATVVHVAAPAAVRPVITNSSPSAGGTTALLFSFPVLLYLGYAAGAIVYWIVRILPAVRRRVLRLSLWAVAAGAAMQVVGAVIKVTTLVARWVSAPVPPDLDATSELLVGLLVSLGFLTLALGVIVPLTDGAIREIPRIRAQRRAARTLEPLWRALHAEFPELALELRSPGPGRALYRRVVEIRDGLVLLSPHFDAAVAERAGRCSQDAGEDATERQAAVHAAVVRGALRDRRAGRPAPEHTAKLTDVTAPGGRVQDSPQDWEDDAATLMRLSRRFSDASA